MEQLVETQIAKRHRDGSVPDPQNGLAWIRQPDPFLASNAHWPKSGMDPHNESAADTGQHWSSFISVWSSAFQMQHGSAYQISANSNGFISGI